MRKFEYVNRVISNGYEMKNPEFNLPVRKTKHAAGYDFECPETTIIPPFKESKQPVLVKTGVKCKMEDDEFLMLCNRSSNPKKKSLVLSNGVGIIDADYYDNQDNEGEIAFAFYNISDKEIILEKGECIGQGIFIKYAKTDNDNSTEKRIGGFGSTDKTKEAEAYLTEVHDKSLSELSAEQIQKFLNNQIAEFQKCNLEVSPRQQYISSI